MPRYYHRTAADAIMRDGAPLEEQHEVTTEDEGGPRPYRAPRQSGRRHGA
jgi:hypothetical protein